MKNFLSKLLFALLPSAAHSDDARLTKIAREFEIRELDRDSVKAHTHWIGTEVGKDDAAYLAEHFDGLTAQQRYEIPTELARTGALAVVPLLEKSLQTSGMPLAGLFFALRMTKPEPGFAKAVAPLVVPWVGKDVKTEDLAAKILAWADPELAALELVKQSMINITNKQAHCILEACNNGGIKVPRTLIDPLLIAWEAPAKDPNTEYRIERGFTEALAALAQSDPVEAIRKANEMIKFRPDWAERLANIPLMSVGLPDLYQRLAEVADAPDEFSALPVAAQHYFAVTYFEADCANGGIVQALTNSTGDYLPLVRKAYEAIDDKRSLDWLETMCRPFGKTGPALGRQERVLQIDAMAPGYFEQVEILEEAWQKRHPDAGWMPSSSWQLARYTAKHAAEIRKALALPDP